MLPKKHFIFGLIFSLILFLIFKITLAETIIIFLSSFLIDVDHYFYYVFRRKNFNLIKAIKWFGAKRKKFKKLSSLEKRKYVGGFNCFHGLETLIILGFLGFSVSKYFYFILIGAGLHLILDYIEIFYNFHYPLKISLIYDFFKFKKLKKI